MEKTTEMLALIKAKAVNCWKSLTILFNMALGLVALYLPDLQASMPDLQEYLPADLYHKLMVVVVIGNVLLRFKTSSALEHK